MGCNSSPGNSIQIISHERNVDSDSIGFEEEPEYLYETLYPIRVYIAKIDSISNWSDSISKNVFLTTEGGEAVYYFLQDTLAKVEAFLFGEMFQKHLKYYLKSDTLVFAYEKEINYNRPIFWDSISMKEIYDNEAFDFNQSLIIETESYFENGDLVRSIDNQDCGAPYNSEYRNMERKRILEEFNELKKLLKK